ncbi:hypothetical protein CTI12_AA235590 [Artemisia annua]|uniref:Uncharacterized protein n=1 Tax=Artemisia annua TaxID=35608 RepID=A0A2U1NS36_ARTAN|nr:hypothetical protein CTI12_AA235590 [Artemisia annua]
MYGPTLADLQLLINDESDEDLIDFEDDAGLMAGDDMDTEDVAPESPVTEQHFDAPSPHPEEPKPSSPQQLQHHQDAEPSNSHPQELDDTRPVTEKVLVEFGEYMNEWLYFQMEDANTDRHLEAAASYADFRNSMEAKQTDLKAAYSSTEEKISGMQATLENLAADQGSKFATLLEAFNKIQQEFKDDPVLITKLIEFMDSHKATSKVLSGLPDLFKGVDFQAIQSQQASVLSTLQAQESKISQLSSGYEQLTTKHNELVNCFTDKLAKISATQENMATELSTLKADTSELKGMVSTIIQLLSTPAQSAQVPPSTAPSQSMAPQSTVASTEATASVEGEKLTPTQRLFQQLNPNRQFKDVSQATTTPVTEPSTEVITEAVPIRSFMPGSTVVLTPPILTEATTITTTLPEPIFSTPSQADKGKGIKTTEDSPPKLIMATRKVRRDPEEPVLFEVTLHNGKVFRGTNEEVAAALEEDDKIKNELLSRQEALESQGLAIPKQTTTIGKKRKAIAQEPEDYIAALHCNRAPPTGVKFVPNKVIKVPEYGIFFVDELNEKAFQRISDIHLVETTTLLAYKLMARNYKSPENEEFMLLMDKMMNERPDKHILLTKKAKLELMGIKEV